MPRGIGGGGKDQHPAGKSDTGQRHVAQERQASERGSGQRVSPQSSGSHLYLTGRSDEVSSHPAGKKLKDIKIDVAPSGSTVGWASKGVLAGMVAGGITAALSGPAVVVGGAVGGVVSGTIILNRGYKWLTGASDAGSDVRSTESVFDHDVVSIDADLSSEAVNDNVSEVQALKAQLQKQQDELNRYKEEGSQIRQKLVNAEESFVAAQSELTETSESLKQERKKVAQFKSLEKAYSWVDGVNEKEGFTTAETISASDRYKKHLNSSVKTYRYREIESLNKELGQFIGQLEPRPQAKPDPQLQHAQMVYQKLGEEFGVEHFSEKKFQKLLSGVGDTIRHRANEEYPDFRVERADMLRQESNESGMGSFAGSVSDLGDDTQLAALQTDLQMLRVQLAESLKSEERNELSLQEKSKTVISQAKKIEGLEHAIRAFGVNAPLDKNKQSEEDKQSFKVKDDVIASQAQAGDNLEGEIKTLETELQASRDEYANQEKMNVRTDDAKRASREQIDTWEPSEIDSKNKLNVMKNELKVLKSSVKDKTETINVLMDRDKSFVEHVRQQDERLSKQQEQLRALNKVMGDDDSDFLELKDRLALEEEQRDRLKGQLSRLYARLEEVSQLGGVYIDFHKVITADESLGESRTHGIYDSSDSVKPDLHSVIEQLRNKSDSADLADELFQAIYSTGVADEGLDRSDALDKFHQRIKFSDFGRQVMKALDPGRNPELLDPLTELANMQHMIKAGLMWQDAYGSMKTKGFDKSEEEFLKLITNAMPKGT